LLISEIGSFLISDYTIAIDVTLVLNELIMDECFLIAAIIPAYDNKKKHLIPDA